MPDQRMLALRGGAPVVPPQSHRLWPEIRAEDVKAVTTLLERGTLSGAKLPVVIGLEKEWARRCGVQHCVATNSGTAALHCAMAATGLQPGDEVIVPALSFVASAFAVAHHGAVPVFADIDASTYTLDAASAAEHVTSRTRAVMPVHLHGLPADMEPINALARQYDLAVIEDAAQAHGATYHGRPVSGLGDCGAFSLNATKGLVGGEGGLFVTESDDMARAARRLCVFGEDVERRTAAVGAAYWSHALGWNYRCAPMAAALARSQLRRLDEVVSRTRECALILGDGLSAIPGITPPYSPPGFQAAWHKYRVRFDPQVLGWEGRPEVLRDRLVAALQSEGVAAALWQTAPLPAHPAFRRGTLRPWSPGDDEDLDPWDPDTVPVTSHVLSTTLLLGSERAPLCAQPPDLMHAYVEAVAKVVAGIDQLRDWME